MLETIVSCVVGYIVMGSFTYFISVAYYLKHHKELPVDLTGATDDSQFAAMAAFWPVTACLCFGYLISLPWQKVLLKDLNENKTN